MKRRILLVNGPCDGRRITDLGTVRIRMAIADGWLCGRPAIGARSGCAIYEFHGNDRARAYWLRNDWEGHIVGNIN